MAILRRSACALVATWLVLAGVWNLHGILTGTRVPVDGGDGQLFVGAFRQGAIYAIYLLGMGAAAWLWTLSHAAPVAVWLPAGASDPTRFVAALGIIASAGAGAAMLWRWPSFGILFVIVTPLWQAFTNGYLEYYPLIAWVLVACLAFAFERPIPQRTAQAWGIMAALLVLVHVELVAVAAILLAVFLVAHGSRGWGATGWALATWLIGVTVIHGPVGSYLVGVWGSINVGEMWNENIYRGLSASPTSVFFRLDYALSAHHLKEVLSMWLRAGGSWAPVEALAGLVVAFPLYRRRDARIALGGALAVWMAIFHICFLPRLGPDRDWDLFWAPVFTFAFLAGRVIDASMEPSRR